MLAIRCLATSATATGGVGVGGLFIPLVVAGAITVAVVDDIVNPNDLDLFIVIGVVTLRNLTNVEVLLDRLENESR